MKKFPDREAHLPEEQRQGYIPDAVVNAIRQAMRERPNEGKGNIHDKNATPAEAPGNMNTVIEALRPSILLPDRDSRLIERKENREILAFEKLSMLAAKTDVELIDQWNSDYLALAYPFTITRTVGGADFKCTKRFRRHPEAAILEPWKATQMHARRVDSNIRTDWNLVPAQRNLTTKWDALCGDNVACKHNVDREKPGNVLAAELVECATKLYEKLNKGFYVDGQGKRRRINHDFTKLHMADGITKMQQDLIRDMTFLSKKFPGTQQVRLLIGHALFGAGVHYGMPLFWTISPSSRHSGLCIRLSRFLKDDIFVSHPNSKGFEFRNWIGEKTPSLVQKKGQE